MSLMSAPISAEKLPRTAGGPAPGPPASGWAGKRLGREWRTMQVMVEVYCRGRHAPNAGLCPECRELLAYAARRLERCQFGAEKPTCAQCPVHCYQRQWRDRIRTVMRYAGPRMLWRYPWLSLRHWVDGVRRPAG